MNPTDPPRQTAVITGATGGIGRELVRQCLLDGMRVVAIGRNTEALGDLSRFSSAPPPSLIPLNLDLLEPNAARSLLDFLDAHDFPADLLINCAGVGLLSRFHESGLSTQTDILRLNTQVPMELTHLLLPRLRSARGAVLNITSLLAAFPAPGLSVLSASKIALLHWSVALRRELKGHVAVTAFSPGITRTPFLPTARMGHLGLDRFFFASDPDLVARRALRAVRRNAAIAYATPLDRLCALLLGFAPHRLVAAAVAISLKPKRPPAGP